MARVVAAGMAAGCGLQAIGQCTVTFAPPSYLVAAGGAGYATAADLNGDGAPDLAIVSGVSGTVTVMLGDGTGGFMSTINYPAPVNTNGAFNHNLQASAADFDVDGDLDLVVACFANTSVAILANNGDGTFLPASVHPAGPTGGLASSAAVGDLNGDGRPDIAVANTGSNKVSLLFNLGDLAFTAPQVMGAGEAPSNVALMDMNLDSKLDLLVSNSSGGTIWVNLGNGDGSFQPPTSTSAGVGPFTLAVGDYNEDGFPDVAYTNISVSDLRVMLGNGTGALASPVISPQAGDQARHLRCADINGDGHLDLVVPCQITPGLVLVCRGDGTGYFNTALSVPIANGGGFFGGPYGVDVADFDLDGRPDIVVAISSGTATGALLRNTTVGGGAPAVTQQPEPVTVAPEGAVVLLTVVASPPIGSPDPTYQWKRNGLPLADGGSISGSQTPTLVIAGAAIAHSGLYQVEVKVPSTCGGFNGTTSDAAVVAVTPVGGCTGDLNSDGVVNGADLGTVLGMWGPCP